ncbi:MAG: hypothetical protein QNJ13_11710 [Paracoccaceae bacterium]|nr:hypothetical protein [Paracoccaceae bacterium]
MPKLIRLYVTHSALGFLISGVFTALVVVFDIARLGYLVTHVEGGWLAAFLFFMLNGIVFAGVQFAIAVMRMAGAEDEGPRGPGRLERRYATVPVVAKRQR